MRRWSCKASGSSCMHRTSLTQPGASPAFGAVHGRQWFRPSNRGGRCDSDPSYKPGAECFSSKAPASQPLVSRTGWAQWGDGNLFEFEGWDKKAVERLLAQRLGVHRRPWELRNPPMEGLGLIRSKWWLGKELASMESMILAMSCTWPCRQWVRLSSEIGKTADLSALRTVSERC